MSDLEEKEKELNKLKAKVDNLLKNQHPASDKIDVRKPAQHTEKLWLSLISQSKKGDEWSTARTEDTFSPRISCDVVQVFLVTEETLVSVTSVLEMN